MIIANNKKCNIKINDKTMLTLSAKDMFEELGYTLFLKDNETLIYRCKNDYVDNSIIFHLGNNFPMSYDVSFIDWIDNSTSDDWVPMSKRKKN